MSEIALQKMLILPSFDVIASRCAAYIPLNTRWTPNKNETGGMEGAGRVISRLFASAPVFGNDAQAAPRFAFATVNLFTGTLRPR